MVSPRKAAAVEVSREVVSVVSVRLHASGVEDSFLLAAKTRALKSKFASSFYSKQREREREKERNKERGIRSRRN